MTKAIFFDIDGTLVSFNTHVIPNSTRLALKQLRQQGVKLFVATGRPWSMIDNLGDVEFDGYITVNGSSCFTASGDTIHNAPIPADDLERLIAYHKENPVSIICVCEDDIFITNYDELSTQSLDMLGIPPVRIAPIEEVRGQNVTQVIIYQSEADEVRTNLFSQVLTHCEPMRWSPLFSDIIRKGNSKSEGINRVLEYYKISLSETMAFGDGGNDIGMLGHVACGIAMGNASDSVKDAAHYVTTTVDDDGIANALEHFGLI